MIKSAFVKTTLIALLLSGSAAYAATEHDNEVLFSIPGLTSFEFRATAYKITNGQPYSGVTSSISRPNEGKVVVKAGRSGSTEVADWFRQQVGGGGTLACLSTSTYPDKLNFAVKGDFTIGANSKTVICKNVLIAQGHKSSSNNWWMGGPDLSTVNIQKCDVVGGGTTEVTFFSDNLACVNQFKITVDPIAP
ncbi:hypothetical protein KVG96_08680 [Pseudomonas sp. COR58]|uniref:Pectate lyase n=1 Tax=Pseudomonas ekonensis TaxID=2842353 RepID=A0ABS6PC22_9PSED|nr:hypothetical protein [Pseudomonas ekonensis]MBV4458019.1 hypothetical protein [Pseudomonas ekonensis]